jgi:hypothetical protein
LFPSRESSDTQRYIITIEIVIEESLKEEREHLNHLLEKSGDSFFICSVIVTAVKTNERINDNKP